MINAPLTASLPGFLVVLASGLAQVDDTGVRTCAARDLAVVSLIEAHGEAQTMQPQTLADAFNQVVDARRACLSGDREEALAIYDRVAAALTRIDGRGTGSGRCSLISPTC